MDAVFREALARGIAALGLAVDPRALRLLERYADRLLAWNRRINLTAITAPDEVAEKHLVDSLALLRILGEPRTVLDVGSGAGLPGIAVAAARPELEVVCCDAVAKKVAFVKAAAADLGLAVRAAAVRAAGDPDREGLPRSDAVVSRALAEPDRWVPLGSRYLAPGGKLFAMLGRDADDAALARAGEGSGLMLEVVDRFELPLSRARRAIVRWSRAGDVSRGT